MKVKEKYLSFYYETMPEVPDPKIDPMKTALLIVDLQNEFVLRDDGEDRSPVQKSEGWNGMLLPVNSYAAAMIDELTPIENEIVVNKTTDSVTTGTNYLTLLNFMGVETVVVCGIVTDQCVASTVRGLADAGYKVICVEDACAAGSMELHDAELKIMSVIYCDVLTTDETIDLIKKAL